MNSLSSRQLIIITPTAPPEACGVSDYAFKAAYELIKYYSRVSIGVERLPQTVQTGIVEIMHWRRLLAHSANKESVCDILINYTPASYAKSGLPIGLLFALRNSISFPGNRLFALVHETWNDSLDLRFDQIVRQRLARLTMQWIGKMATSIAVATSAQQQKLQKLMRLENVRLIPIGSNILPQELASGLTSERQPGNWLVFGLPHTRLWALEASLPLLKAMYQQGILRHIYAVGPADNIYAQQEHTLIATNLSANVLVQVGKLSPIEVSLQMLSAEAAITSMDTDGIRKSGTFAALAAHAIPIICDAGQQLEQMPYSACFRSDELLINPALIGSAEGEYRRRQMHTWFWKTRSWDVIGQDISAWLQNDDL